MTPLPVSDIKFIKPKHAQDENHHNPTLEHADSPLLKRRNTGTPLIPKKRYTLPYTRHYQMPLFLP